MKLLCILLAVSGVAAAQTTAPVTNPAGSLGATITTLDNVPIGQTTAAPVNAAGLKVIAYGTASSGGNINSRGSVIVGSCYNGSAGTDCGAQTQVFPGTGTNPVVRVETNNYGSAGGVLYLWDSPINVPAVQDTGLTASSPAPVCTGANSQLTQSGCTAYAPVASPALTGTPTAPTAAAGTNTTQLATTAFVLANATASTILRTTVTFASLAAGWNNTTVTLSGLTNSKTVACSPQDNVDGTLLICGGGFNSSGLANVYVYAQSADASSHVFNVIAQ